MYFNDEEITILKRVIIDYKAIKETINKLINNGATLKDIYNYIETRKDCNFTNVDFEIEKYFDFNYRDMCISVYDYGTDKIGVYVGDTIEVWNDKKQYYIGTYNNVEEIEREINNE